MSDNDALKTLIDAQIASIGSQGSKTLTDAEILGLYGTLGPMLPAALDLIDHSDVVKFQSSGGMVAYQVHGTASTYSVLYDPNVPNSVSSCTCPSFVYGVILNSSHTLCKHLLAVRLAERLNRGSLRVMTLDQLATAAASAFP